MDPDTCVDFKIQGNIVTDKYRDNYDKIFRKDENLNGRVHKTRRPSADKRS